METTAVGKPTLGVLGRHDPVGHPPAGAWVHPLLARLRDPAYVASQQVRAEPEEPA